MATPRSSVITLQFGGYANYVGAHFWNFQDELAGAAYTQPDGWREVSHDVLYRAGQDSGGRAAYTPHLLLFDVAGSDGLCRARRGASGLTMARLALGGESERVAAYARAQRRPNPFLEGLDACENGEGEEEKEEEEERGGEGEQRGGGGGGLGAWEPALGAEAGDLEGVVRCWGDFCKADLDPRGLVGVGGRDAFGDGAGAGDAGSALRSGRAAFDAYTDGRGLVDDGAWEPARRLLEAADAVGGFQAVVDVDSGWGGFAGEYLAALRDECPRAPLLVLGAAAPAPAHGGGAGVLEARRASMLRRVNLALAFAEFAGPGGAELDATFVPLSLQGALAAAEGGGGGALAAPRWRSAFSTSALLAAGWDTATLPFRRNGAPCGGGGEPVLPLAAADARRGHGGGARGSGDGAAGALAGRMAASAATPPSSRGGGGGGGPGAGAGGPPLAALPSITSLAAFLGHLRGGLHSTLRVCELSLAAPLPFPRLSAGGFSALLRALPPASVAAAALFSPLSAVAGAGAGCAPRRFASAGAAAAAEAATREGAGTAAPAATTPFAHVLVVRGVGCASLRGGRYSCGAEDYGRALDGYVARDGARGGAHAFFRTPLPLPLTFPRALWPPGAFDALGGVAAGGVPRGGPAARAPGVAAALSVAILDEGDSGGGPSEALPFSTPAAVHVSNTPTVGAAVGALLAAFERRDRAYDSRFGGGVQGASAAGFEDAAGALAALAEVYTPGARA